MNPKIHSTETFFAYYKRILEHEPDHVLQEHVFAWQNVSYFRKAINTLSRHLASMEERSEAAQYWLKEREALSLDLARCN